MVYQTKQSCWLDKNRVGQSISPSLPLVYRRVVVGLGWYNGVRLQYNQQLVSSWVRIPGLTADHFHSLPVV